ncbi:hypothetical protein D3C87_1049060 [compost metagenome]
MTYIDILIPIVFFSLFFLLIRFRSDRSLGNSVKIDQMRIKLKRSKYEMTIKKFQHNRF